MTAIAFAFSWLVLAPASHAAQAEREQFALAWNAASRGDRAQFEQLRQGLESYRLYPYLQYEDLRHRRARAPAEEMAGFLAAHAGWAFTPGLRRAWLRSLGQQRRWSDILDHSDGIDDTVIRCYRARARVQRGLTDGLLAEAQDLWAAPQSQPDECDPLFDWLRAEKGITGELAWKRVRLAMEAGNARLTLYLARFIPAQERPWLERWQDLDRRRYRNLGAARNWPDEPLPRMIAAISLQRLARHDADLAWQEFLSLDAHFSWSGEQRNASLREIALQAAVDLSPRAMEIMNALPDTLHDDQILQWWARTALVAEDWNSLQSVIGRMAPETRFDGRWRYWLAVALAESGDSAGGQSAFQDLAAESNYYGFLAADRLDRPYSICPLQPAVTPEAIAQLAAQEEFARALELRAVRLENWALAEWTLATGRLDATGLRTAAGLAWQEAWHDRAIFSLGDSGDLRYYDWRFPLLWTQEVASESARNRLDPAWVHGVMRSESALLETARSSAGALGLMQVTPATARQLSRQHGIAYHGSAQLQEAESNIRFGTRYLRDLLDRYRQNPVLVSGAYNAGPAAVDRWLRERPAADAEVWIESIPYFETRDYIPRVMAFTTIYDWRMNGAVHRVSSRMPDLDSGTIGAAQTTGVVCALDQQDSQAG